MASSQLINVGIGLGVLSLLLLVAVLLGAHKSKSRYSTPGIASKEDGVLTSSISMLLQANADEVFDVILNFEDYSWASNTRYAWNDENPGVGSTGTITVSNEKLRLISHLISIALPGPKRAQTDMASSKDRCGKYFK